MQHSAMVDEQYMAIGSNIDQALQEKIVKGEYVDFVRLLARDKPQYDDNRLEIVNKGGCTYFVLALESFYKWEEVFRTYSNLYLRGHPHKTAELIQYNHIIFTASMSYVWENVYTYDKEFRSHLAVFPDYSWAIILQQAWSM